MAYQKKKSTLTRAIKIDMPDELRPIYDVCQDALDEILATDSVRTALEGIVLGKREDNRSAISAAVGSVWSKYKSKVPAPSKYERILFRHSHTQTAKTKNLPQKREEGVGGLH